MAVTVALDAGHGGYDSGAVHEGRREKDDNLALALAVGDILQRSGVNVVFTRTEDVHDSPVRKAGIANESGADYFISFHRNSSPVDNQYSGVETLLYDENGVKADMARAINEELAQVGFNDLGLNIRRDLAVLRRTQMPALLVEVGFINTDADNALLDARFDDVAQAIANGVLQTIGGEIGPGQGMLMSEAYLIISSFLNHFAFTISSPSTFISPESYSASKPSINEFGNGQD